MSLVKPSGIQGLDSGHPLNANIKQFFDIGQSNKELVSDSTFTHGGTVVSDASIGDSVEFSETNVGVSINALVADGDTVLTVYRHVGTSGNQGLDGEFVFLYGEEDGNAFKLRYFPASSPTNYNYEVNLRANFSGYFKTRFYPFTHADDTGYRAAHAVATVVDVTGTTVPPFSFDGALQSEVDGEGAPNTNFATPPVSADIATSSGSVGTTRLAAIVVFNKTLSTAELNSVTTDPWAMVSTGASLTVTQTELTPGDTISGTYADYETVPTTLTVSDGTNTITIASPTINDNGDGTGDFSGTMPELPTSGTANLILFGDVDVELT